MLICITSVPSGSSLWNSFSQRPVSMSQTTSYCKISQRLELRERFVFRVVRSLWNLTGTSSAVLPTCLSNSKRYDDLSYQYCSFETSWDHTKRLIGYWNGAQIVILSLIKNRGKFCDIHHIKHNKRSGHDYYMNLWSQLRYSSNCNYNDNYALCSYVVKDLFWINCHRQ